MKPLAVCLLALMPVSTTIAQVASHAMRQTTNTVSVTKPVGKPIARVNGAVLTDRDLLNEMFQMFPYARQHNGGFPKAMEADIRKGALQMIEFEELVYQEAQRRKMSIPATKLNKALADFRKQFPSDEEFQDFLKTEVNGSQEQLRAKIERSLLIDQLLKAEVADKSVVSPTGVKAYYDKNPDHFTTPESLAFQSITILAPDKATPTQLKEVRKQADEALRQAKGTKTYDEFWLLAEKISQDDFRVMMGDHKSVDRSKLPPEVVAATSRMQIGQVSDVIQFGQAYAILRLNGHTPAGKQSFEAVKKSLLEQLEKNKTQQLRSDLGKKLRATAKVEEL
jgi:parvulin-like peptidyl-prolyl isomerase